VDGVPLGSRAVPDVLIYGDTIRSHEMRHEVPVAVPDPFFYAEKDGERHVAAHSMELARMDGLGLVLHSGEEFGMDELLRSGKSLDEIRDEYHVRVCRGLGIEDAVVPFWFPLHVADNLRANGIRVRTDRSLFAERRRRKTEAELAGIRRAQRAAEAGMTAARELLRRATANGAGVTVDGEPLTVEWLKEEIIRAFLRNSANGEDLIVSHGPQTAIGHELGSGALVAGEPIVIDIFPRDAESACFADMTRTFVVGEPPTDLVEWQRLCKQALDRAIAGVRSGVDGKEVFDATCEIFEAAGFPTARMKEPGKPLIEGFFHALGHGVGLDVHEEPTLGLIADKTLIAGDVITIEPGLYRQGFGGCRLEDLVLVTDDGAENLTSFPYDLEP
jgi:Xaa-Pro aminopeptidase